MKMKNLSTLILIIILFASCEKSKTTKIHGTVKNAETEYLLLVGLNQDFRFDSIIQIPVIEGNFSHNLNLEQPIVLTMFLDDMVKKGGGSYMPVFIEPGEIEIKITDKELYTTTQVNGGNLNKEYQSYRQNYFEQFESKLNRIFSKRDSLHKIKKYNSKAMNNIFDSLSNTDDQIIKNHLYERMEYLQENNLEVSPEALVWKIETQKLREETDDFTNTYIKENNSLVSYYLFLTNLKYYPEKYTATSAQGRLEKFEEKFTFHPYNTIAQKWIHAIDNIKVGKPFIDFNAETIEGTTVLFSDIIDDKYILLDLWATWCGPCIGRTQEMIPIYEKYRNQNFTIIGVAGEYKNLDRLNNFLEKEQWPWRQLVDLDHKNEIWLKYGVDGSGGATFLIDPSGNIIAKNPKPEEVDQILAETKL